MGFLRLAFKNLDPFTRSAIFRDILEPFHFKALLDLRRSQPRETRSERVTQRKLDRPLSPRGRCNGTLYVENASASGLGALFLCPLIIIIIIIIHLLPFFPRSSLLCPPADLFFVSYFRSLCHTVVHRAHLTPRITAMLSSRTPWPFAVDR